MEIARKPVVKPVVADDTQAEQFIAGAGQGAPPPPPSPPPPPLPPAEPDQPRGRVPTMVRFDPQLLMAVDAAAKRRGISRSAWIQYTLSEALEEQA